MTSAFPAPVDWAEEKADELYRFAYMANRWDTQTRAKCYAALREAYEKGREDQKGVDAGIANRFLVDHLNSGDTAETAEAIRNLILSQRDDTKPGL